MSNLVWFLLPLVLPVILYIYILTRKGEFERAKKIVKSFDWFTFFSLIFAGSILSSSLRAAGIELPYKPWFSIGLVLFIAIILIVAIRKARKGRPIIQPFDERWQAIYAKSSRNTLFATYLTLVIHHDVTKLNTLDADWMVITISSGLFMFFASLTFYYFRKSF